MKRTRFIAVIFLIAIVSAACLIPQEMAAYILPYTPTSTLTITSTSVPSLTPFLPLTH